MSANIRSIIFDFGNVVGFFDYNRAWERVRPHTDLTPAEIMAAIADANLEDLYETGCISSEEFLCRLRAVCRLRCTDDHVVAAWCEIFRPNEEVCRLIPRLRPTYRLVLGSNTNELHYHHFRMQFADVLAHFDALALSFEVGARKPRPEFFRRCVELARCAPQECVFIDDLPTNVEGALACGLHGIVYRDPNDLTRRLAALGVEPGGLTRASGATPE